MSDCNVVCNLDYRALLERHIASGADVTIGCCRGRAPKTNAMRLRLDEDGRVKSMRLSAEPDAGALYSLNIFVLRKALLERLIAQADDDSDYGFIRRNAGSARMCAAVLPGYARVIDSLQSYYDVSMELLRTDVRASLFAPARPVLTKVQDDMPTIYGLHSGVRNCLAAEGCQLRGTVENSVLFRGVTVEEGAVVQNCVLMQGTYVSANARLRHVIADKSVVVKPGKTLVGVENFPIYLGKKIVI
jgi:glucose-1-phosphate adenylyltransferase